MITARIVLDSVSEADIRLTTLELVYPKFIHGEFMTHRVFSRNASSSRAIPVKTMIERIRSHPAGPVSWGSAKAGMQAGESIAAPELARQLWLQAAYQACNMAERMLELNLHKQIVNRVMEPFAHITVLVTATEWENFFELRDHPDAQPEICELAKKMKLAFLKNEPQLLQENQWHLPFITHADANVFGLHDCRRISTARCARVSYLNHDGSNPDPIKDLDLYHKLIIQKPIHASPTEHIATPYSQKHAHIWNKNFRGWIQYRTQVEKGGG